MQTIVCMPGGAPDCTYLPADYSRLQQSGLQCVVTKHVHMSTICSSQLVFSFVPSFSFLLFRFPLSSRIQLWFWPPQCGPLCGSIARLGAVSFPPECETQTTSCMQGGATDCTDLPADYSRLQQCSRGGVHAPSQTLRAAPAALYLLEVVGRWEAHQPKRTAAVPAAR